MFTLAVMDNDKCISSGIAQYFKDRQINVRVMTNAQARDAVSFAAKSDIVISELSVFGWDVQAITEIFIKLQLVSPATRLIILTDLDESAVINYISSLLPRARILSKRCDIHRLASEVFSCAAQDDSKPLSFNLKPPKDALTAREFRLLRFLASNSSLTDIGHLLDLSVKTVSYHKKNIMRKLNCQTSVELPSRLARMGYGMKKRPNK
ncbi:hypothetical protein CIG19_01055 [Enterobacterales bacterium CwR94]|nr:hypothetical protein CIG19_01055 [Enterobacterales bacterium CwR94]